MLQLPPGMTASHHLGQVTYKLESLLCCSHFLQFKVASSVIFLVNIVVMVLV